MEYRNLRPILPTVAQIKSVRPHTHHQFWFQQTDWCENGDVLTTGEICETKDLFDNVFSPLRKLVIIGEVCENAKTCLCVQALVTPFPEAPN